MDIKEEQRNRSKYTRTKHDLFRSEIIRGLQKAQKELPSKYLYDEYGSYLYECICSLEEYYIPQTEAKIMASYIYEMVELLGPGVTLIEYGCGSCAKTRILLDNLYGLSTFVPIDISREQLFQVADELSLDYPSLEILPVCADFTRDLELPVTGRWNQRTVVYFPGSTIGNFDPIPARNFLERVADVCGPGGALLIGVDLRKDPDVLHKAYNDREGVTAAFNLNLLTRINRELEGDFNPDYFEHRAIYNREQGRIEMHLISLRSQVVHIGNINIPFVEGESIWTENSYKYSLVEFEKLANAAGFSVEKVWTDERQWFSVQYLVSTAGTT